MSVVSLGRFQLRDEAGIGPCWCPPAGVTALIDLVPPGQDADPDVNFALMLSDSPLDSNDCIYSLGTGNVTETQLDGAGQDAWETITGFRPTQGAISDAIAQHLLNHNGANGQDFARPLTAGFNRGLEIHLGGEVWSHTLTGLSDPLSLPVLRVEAEGLSEIYRTQGETQYRLAMGALRRKYDTRPIKELIAILFPSGRDDLPLMDELTPQTSKTETWPSTGAITSGQDQTWSIVAGGFSVTPAGTVTTTIGGSESTALLGYTFGGSDRAVSWIQGLVSASSSGGAFARVNAALSDGYLFDSSATDWKVHKRVGGTYTALVTVVAAVAAGNTIFGSAIGSTLLSKVNGSQIDSRTDTAISTGTRSGLRLFSGGFGGSLVGPLVMDDLISASGGPFPFFTSRRMRGGFVGMNGGL